MKEQKGIQTESRTCLDVKTHNGGKKLTYTDNSDLTLKYAFKKRIYIIIAAVKLNPFCKANLTCYIKRSYRC